MAKATAQQNARKKQLILSPAEGGRGNAARGRGRGESDEGGAICISSSESVEIDLGVGERPCRVQIEVNWRPERDWGRAENDVLLIYPSDQTDSLNHST